MKIRKIIRIIENKNKNYNNNNKHYNYNNLLNYLLIKLINDLN